MSAEIIAITRKRASRFEAVKDASGKKIPHLFRNVASQIIYFREEFKLLGIPGIFKSTKKRTIGKAKTRGELLKQQHLNKYLGIDDSHAILKRREKTFAFVASEVLEDHSPLTRKGTQANHAFYIKQLMDAFGEYDIDSITTRLFQDWIKKLKRTAKRKTFSDYAKNMNLVMRYAYNQKYCRHLTTFKNPDQGLIKTGRVFTDAEIQALWASMSEDLRDEFVLCYECMMRLREMLHLTWDRVDLTTGIITLRAQDVKTGSKTGKGRSFVMSPKALIRMKDRFDKRLVRSPFVFPSPIDPKKPMGQNKTAWRGVKLKAGIEGKARWHDLRHSALSKALLELKANPVQVSEYAGVSIRTIQAVYLHSKAEQTKEVAGLIKI